MVLWLIFIPVQPEATRIPKFINELVAAVVYLDVTISRIKLFSIVTFVDIPEKLIPYAP